eukprot:1156671-Pelagomonas_calceolata.AAC.8
MGGVWVADEWPHLNIGLVLNAVQVLMQAIQQERKELLQQERKHVDGMKLITSAVWILMQAVQQRSPGDPVTGACAC